MSKSKPRSWSSVSAEYLGTSLDSTNTSPHLTPNLLRLQDSVKRGKKIKLKGGSFDGIVLKLLAADSKAAVL